MHDMAVLATFYIRSKIKKETVMLETLTPSIYCEYGKEPVEPS
jgi:hypothetical protein